MAVLLFGGAIDADEPMIVAHRGASHDAPENTLPAFQLAWEQGADAIEGDFRLTKDGRVVCIHDADTKRVAKRKLEVHESTLAELRQLDVGVWKDKRFEGTPIPTIDEVLATIPDRKSIYIEIKCGPEIIPGLLEEIDRSGLTAERIVVLSFNEKVLKELQAKAPELKVAWLCSFKKEERSGAIGPSLDKVLGTLEMIGACALSSNAAIPEAFVELLKQNGYDWHVWTVNDLNQAKRMKRLGVKSITTDMPGRLRQHIPPGGPLARPTPGQFP